MANPAKRHKRGSLLIDLPHDILEIIFDHLSSAEVMNLSLLNQEFRMRLVPYIFRCVRSTWGQIIELQKARGGSPISKYSSLIRSVRIAEANSYNEYQQRTFGLLLSPEVLPSLLSATVNSGNLSYWLKYNECDHIRSLSLYSDAEQMNSIKIFHLSHVSGFHGLKLLCLSKYHFNWVEDEALHATVGLETLSLHDCTWEYPFDLKCFNRNDTLRTLRVTYTNDNPFILLERFVGFLEDPIPGHSRSLCTLEIKFHGFTCNKKYLTPNILQQILHSFDGIDVLLLEGWIANFSYLRPLIRGHHFPFETKILLAVEAHGEMTAQEFKKSLMHVKNLSLKVNTSQ